MFHLGMGAYAIRRNNYPSGGLMFYYFLSVLCILIFVSACLYETQRLKKETEEVNRLLTEFNDPTFSRLCKRLYIF